MSDGFVGFAGHIIEFVEHYKFWLLVPMLLLTFYLGLKVYLGIKGVRKENDWRVGNYVMAFVMSLVFTVFIVAASVSVDKTAEPEEVNEQPWDN